MVGATLAVGLCGAVPPASQAWDQAPAQGGQPALLAFCGEGDAEHRLLTVVEPTQRVICVYQIDVASGQIALRSVRNIEADLKLLEYNGQSPHPQEVRSMTERVTRRTAGTTSP